MIITGSREWGDPGRSEEWARHEANVSAAVVAKLIGRWVIGRTSFKQRDREAPPGPGLVVVQGGARGADAFAAAATRLLADGLRRTSREAYATVWAEPAIGPGLWLETYPANWDAHGKAAGGLRNQEMLNLGTDHVVALYAHGRPYGLDERGGTNDMVRRAVRAGVPVDVYVCDDRRWRKP